MDNKIMFNRKVNKQLDTCSVTIPIEIVRALGIDKGDMLKCYLEKGKYGYFIAYWKEEKEEEKEEELTPLDIVEDDIDEREY